MPSELLPSPNRLIFLHIHKTGGLSLRNLILRSCRGQKHWDTGLGEVTGHEWQQYLKKLRELPSGELESYRLFLGHMPFGLHEVLPDGTRYVTFLRDPVRRMTSYFHMRHRAGWGPAPSTIDPSRPDWNLPGDPLLLRTLDNGQTRLLAGACLPFGQCNETHLQTARANLDRHFDLVGLTENFTLSLALLRRMYGWKWHFYVPRNVAPQTDAKSRIPPEVVREIERLNRFDLELYAYAKQRLHEQARRCGFSLKAGHALFISCNRAHRLVQKTRKSVKRRIVETLSFSLNKAGRPDADFTKKSPALNQFLR
ncbi:hypothetical protein OAG63_00195 [Methylacidiphilales bacterium]|nr:hypothetical protein [Candidatus Methylacidiphilales bacterium]